MEKSYWYAICGLYETSFIVTNFERIMRMKQYIKYQEEARDYFYTPMVIKARLKKKRNNYPFR